MTTVSIRFSNLWTHGKEDQRLPLIALVQRGEIGHIHGRLEIEIGGRLLPRLGFFDADDVCIDTWLVELCTVVRVLDQPGGEYTFDEGEQGQPAFEFVRRGEEMSLSIVVSALTGCGPDLSWRNVTCRYSEFRSEVIRLVAELQDEVRLKAPRAWARWWPKAAVIS